jgi:chromosomal replication initiator protein
MELFHSHAKLEVWGDAQLREYRQMRRDSGSISFNPQFSFENYVTGSSNEIALKIAVTAAENPGQEVYNPLFLYGPAGVGKTHLLYAVANRVLEKTPESQVVYIRGDQFTVELINAIRNGKTDDFKRKYRQADVLLVDDIQFIAGKEATQEEFFHTFNALFEHKKQIILSADRRPSEMAQLEDRLCDRFGEGILVGIAPPDYETRLSIIRSKAKRLNLDLDEQTIKYLASDLTDNVRQIEGALKKIRAFRDLSGMELTLGNVVRTVEDISSVKSKAAVTPEQIIRQVCKYYGIQEAALKGPQKSKGIALPRQIAMYLIRDKLKMNYVDIGKLMSRDHGTVLHSVRKVEQELANPDGKLNAAIQDILSGIEQCI